MHSCGDAFLWVEAKFFTKALKDLSHAGSHALFTASKTQANSILSNCEPRCSKIPTLTVQLGNEGSLGAFSELPRCLYPICCINLNSWTF